MRDTWDPFLPTWSHTVPEFLRGWPQAVLNTHRGVPLALAALLAIVGSVISRDEFDQRWCLVMHHHLSLLVERNAFADFLVERSARAEKRAA